MTASASPFPRTIVFDLDGTLVDTAPDVTRAVNYALRRVGCRPVAQTQVRALLGRGSKALIATALESVGRPAQSDSEISALLRPFLEFYSANIAVESRPFPGAVEALSVLRRGGAQMAICTNKFEAMSRKLIAALRLEAYFDANLGGDSLPVRKPDPGHLLAAIAQAGGTPDSAVLIGDSRADAGAAKAAGVPVVLVGFGYSDVPVETLEADALIDHFSQLPGVLAALCQSSA